MNENILMGYGKSTQQCPMPCLIQRTYISTWRANREDEK